MRNSVLDSMLTSIPVQMPAAERPAVSYQGCNLAALARSWSCELLGSGRMLRPEGCVRGRQRLMVKGASDSASFYSIRRWKVNESAVGR